MGKEGFAAIGEHLKDDTLKRYFFSESLKRAELYRSDVQDILAEGPNVGTVHRAWGDLKASISSLDDTSLLQIAEQGEDRSRAAYEDALKGDLTQAICQLSVEQQAQIQSGTAG